MNDLASREVQRTPAVMLRARGARQNVLRVGGCKDVVAE